MGSLSVIVGVVGRSELPTAALFLSGRRLAMREGAVPTTEPGGGDRASSRTPRASCTRRSRRVIVELPGGVFSNGAYPPGSLPSRPRARRRMNRQQFPSPPPLALSSPLSSRQPRTQEGSSRGEWERETWKCVPVIGCRLPAWLYPSRVVPRDRCRSGWCPCSRPRSPSQARVSRERHSWTHQELGKSRSSMIGSSPGYRSRVLVGVMGAQDPTMPWAVRQPRPDQRWRRGRLGCEKGGGGRERRRGSES